MVVALLLFLKFIPFKTFFKYQFSFFQQIFKAKNHQIKKKILIKKKTLEYNDFQKKKIIKFKMIFPQPENSSEQSSLSSEQVQKEALEYIVSLYLDRKTDDDLGFLNKHFSGETEKLITSLDSDGKNGLTDKAIQRNKQIYGQNAKKKPIKCFSLTDIIQKQFISWNFICVLIIFIGCFVFSLIRENKVIFRDMAELFGFNIVLSLTRIGIQYYYEQSLASFALERDKNNWYRVTRNRQIIEVQEHDLVVGDILQIGFKEKIPASGILISREQITVSEVSFNRKYQRKMPLEKCTKAVQEMSNLEQKLCFQNQTLPSPVLIRGTELIQGNAFKMIVVTVTEDDLIEKSKSELSDGYTCIEYEKWKRSFLSKWNIITLLIFCIGSIIISLAKIISYELLRFDAEAGGDKIADILGKISLLAFILNSANMKTFLRMKMNSLITSLEIPEKLTQFLTTDRLLVSEVNIVKYDVFQISKFAFLEKNDISDIEQLHYVHATTAGMAEEVISGVDVEYCIASMHDGSGKENLNSLIQVYNKENKIVTCLSKLKLTQPTKTSKIMPKRIKNRSSKLGSSKHGSGVASMIKRNSVFQLEDDLGKSNKKRGSLFLEPITQTLSDDQANFWKVNQLNTIISPGFRRSLLEGITDLAEKQCRTYYMCAYSEQSLEQIPKVIFEGRQISLTSEMKEKLKKMTNRLALIYELDPVLLGFNNGFYSSKSIEVLVCIGGVNFKQENLIIKDLQLLSLIGIKLLIMASAEKQMEASEYKTQIINDYCRRQLISKEENQVVDMEEVKNSSGRLVCSECLIKNCNCLNKKQQLSNIQAFIPFNQNTKIIYNVYPGKDIRYLECAYSQLCHNPLVLASSKTKTQHIIESIIQSIKFLEMLKGSVRFWVVTLIINTSFCLIIWITTNQVLFTGQIVWIVGLTRVCGFCVGLLSYESKIQDLGRLNRNKVQVVKKEDGLMLCFLFFFLNMFGIIMSQLPGLLPEYPDAYDQLIQKYSLNATRCKYGPNSTVSVEFSSSLCTTPETEVFSRISTIMATYLFLVNWILLIMHHWNPKNPLSIVVYLGMPAIFLLLTYETPEYMDGYPWGLEPLQLVIVFVLAFVTVLVSSALGMLCSLANVSNYFSEELSSQIIFNPDFQNHYTTALKHYHKQMQRKQSIF